MKKFVFLLLSIPSVIFCQEIKITPEGITPVVIQIDSMSSKQIYNKVKSYINKNYTHPDKVILADEDGVLLRVKSFEKIIFKSSFGEKRFWYTYDIEFKDNKYKISFFDINIEATILNSPDSFFNNKGELRKQGWYSDSYEKYTLMINNINEEIKKAIKTKNDW